MGMNIVAISGKLTSGKSTLANNIVKVDSSYRVVPLAYPLKQAIAELCGTSLEFMREHKDKFRPILQYYGTDIMRWLYGEDIWVERLFEYAYNLDLQHLIVDDVRYPNEVEGLANRADKFMSVRLLINTDDQIQRYHSLYGEFISLEKLNHRSETALDTYTDFDMVVRPNMPLDLLTDQVLAGMNRRSMTEFAALPQELIGVQPS